MQRLIISLVWFGCMDVGCVDDDGDAAAFDVGEIGWAASDAASLAQDAADTARWRSRDLLARFAGARRVEVRNIGVAPVPLHGYRVAAYISDEDLDVEGATPVTTSMLPPGGRAVVDVGALPSEETLALIAPDDSIVRILRRPPSCARSVASAIPTTVL